MPYRRTLRKARAPKRKIVVRRKRVAPRRRRVAAPLRQPSFIAPQTLNPHKVKPMYRKTTVSLNYTFGTAGQLTMLTTPSSTTQGVSTLPSVIRLDAIPVDEYNALKALYTHYKIKKVVYTFTMNSEGFTGIVANATVIPKLYIRYTYDSDSLAATLANFAEMQNVKVFQFGGEGNQARYTWYPRVLQTVYQSSGIVSSNSPARPRWFDIDYGGMQHYGCAFIMPFMPAGATLTLEQEITYCVKDQR